MQKVLLQTSENIVHYRTGEVEIRTTVISTFLVPFILLVIGGALVLDPLDFSGSAAAGRGSLAHYAMFYSGMFFSGLGVLVLLVAFSRFLFPITFRAGRVQIGRKSYRFSDLSNIRIDTIRLRQNRLYTLVADVAGRRKYLCRGVPEAKLPSLQEVEKVILDMVRAPREERAGPDIEFGKSLEKMISFAFIPAGAMVALVCWAWFPNYRLVSIFASPDDPGSPLWSIGVFMAYVGLLNFIGFPIRKILGKETSAIKRYLTMALVIVPLLVLLRSY